MYAAFAAIYLIWGSTYYFIREGLSGIPPMMLGALRFLIAAAILFGWCLARGQRIAPGRHLKDAALSGVLLLALGNGVVVWVEQDLPSSVVAIMIAVAPLSFIVLDKAHWHVNFRSAATLIGVVAGFAGVLLLFSGSDSAGPAEGGLRLRSLLILLIAVIAWPAGSLYAKYHPSTLPNLVTSAWQMVAGGLCFLCAGVGRGELRTWDWHHVPAGAWISLGYLVVFGSIIGFSAYVWLLQVRPAAQVSTYAYVNPVVAVLLGVLAGGERIGWREIAGLVVILGGVLSINLARYRQAR